MAILDHDVKKAEFESSKDLLKVAKVHTNASLDMHFLDMYAKKIYITKEESVVRELLTNAIDAHKVSGKDKVIDIKLPDETSPTFRIRDGGNGLSDDFMRTYYLDAGYSTKNKSNEFAGYMGIGRLSVFTLSDEYFVTSIHDGIKSKYLLRWESEAINIYLLSSHETEDDSGFEVEFSVKKERWETLIITSIPFF